MADFEHVIHELLSDEVSVGESMFALVDAHAAEYPDGDWTHFHAFAYDREIPYLQRNWFPAVIENDPPATVPVAGLRFGLFNPLRDREELADFYVAGSPRFELDGDPDWAVGPEYFPEGRYAHSAILADIHRAAYGSRDGLANDAEEYLCLGYVAFAVKQILAEADLNLILATDQPVGVAVGWDSGDPLYIGFVSRNGFQVRNAEDAIKGILKRREKWNKEFRERFDSGGAP